MARQTAETAEEEKEEEEEGEETHRAGEAHREDCEEERAGPGSAGLGKRADAEAAGGAQGPSKCTHGGSEKPSQARGLRQPLGPRRGEALLAIARTSVPKNAHVRAMPSLQ
ncbi:unnamed protein product [Prorocentrum cordatum]|uniref:Uncharacterized protein n=1 Tax=Prorocentrum cordatum TaxID=2364126 RepID=A0ABN9Q2U8_9DINO|nr:unnamed protein product [Polarella glacialis]